MVKPIHLNQYVPQPALAYCLLLWENQPFRLILKKQRSTKVGDFIWRKGQEPKISINKNLNSYSFLLTYVHEVAHLHAHRSFGRGVRSHGAEWKQVFQQLMQPLISSNIFPDQLHHVLVNHLKNPKASTFSDLILTRELRKFDNEINHSPLLNELTDGSIFLLHGRKFIKGELRRTRVKCIEIGTRREYLIRKDVAIEIVT